MTSVHLHDGEIHTHVDAQDAATMGFLLDLVTVEYGSNPARPDSEGNIVRKLAPDVMVRGTDAVKSLLEAADVALILDD